MNEGREILCFPSALAGERKRGKQFVSWSLAACTVLLIKYAAGHNNKLTNATRLSAVSTKHNLPELELNCRQFHKIWWGLYHRYIATWPWNTNFWMHLYPADYVPHHILLRKLYNTKCKNKWIIITSCNFYLTTVSVT